MFDLEFTGERVVPGKVEPELQLEHSTRYQLAARWVRGKQVLDFGCGTGYGAAILKRAGARQVVGCDLSPTAVLYAKSHFEAPGLSFCVTDCENSGLAADKFDVIVSFELIEHLKSYPKYLEEVRRLLPPDGLFVVSTPNKTTYNDPRHNAPNPFHIHEFELEEFRDALASFFSTVKVLGQSRTEGVFFHGESGDTRDRKVALEGSRGPGRRPPEGLATADYFIAICGDDSGAVEVAGDSFHIAKSNVLRDRNLRILELQGELEERTQWARSLENESSRRGQRVVELQQELEERTQWAKQLESESTSHSHRVLELQAELQERLRWASEVGSDNEAKEQRIRELRQELELLGQAMERLAGLEGRIDRRIAETRGQLEREVLERLGQLEGQLDQRIVEARSSLSSDVQQWKDLTRDALDERRSSHAIQLEQRHQSHEAQVDQRHRTHATQLEATIQTQLQALDQPRQELEEQLQRTSIKAEELAKRWTHLHGLNTWQRDSLIHHQEKIERQQVALDEERRKLSELQRQQVDSQQQVDHQEQLLEQHRQQLQSQVHRTEELDQRHTANSQQLRTDLDHQAETQIHQQDLQVQQGDAIDAQGHLLRQVEQSLIYTRRLSELLWNSAPWQLYCKLSAFLRAIRNQLPKGRRERHARQVAEADQMRRRLQELSPVHPPRGQPQVSLVIPYDSPSELLDCLQRILEVGSGIAFEVVGIHSTPTSAAHTALDAHQGLQVYHCHRHGHAAALRLAAKKARGEHLLLLRCDARVEAGWLDQLYRTFDLRHDAKLVGGRLLNGAGELLAAGNLLWNDASTSAYGNGENPELRAFSFAREVDFCDDACWLIHRSLISVLDQLDGKLLDSAQRAADFSLRCRQLGARTYYQPAAKVRLANGLTKAEPSALQRGRQRLGKRWPAELAAMPAPGLPRAAAESRLVKRALVLDHRLPTPDQDAGSLRMDAMLGVLQQLGFQVTFLPENLYAMEPYCEPLQARGVEVVTFPEETSLRGYLESHGERYELAIVSRFHIAIDTLDMVRELCPQAVLVFDTVDLQFLRMARQARLEGNDELARSAEQTRRAEIELASRADAVLVVSEVERQLLAEHAPQLDVHLVSLIHELGEAAGGFDQRKDLFFVGGYEHPPNQDAALWFARHIWPRVRARLPEVELYLLGSKVTDEIQALDGDGIKVVGFVADLEPHLRGCKLAIAPLRYGAGIKGKVTESLAHGLPMVMTTIAAEGIDLEHRESAMIADDPAEFADSLVELYTDGQLWQRLSTNGQQVVHRQFSPAQACQVLTELLTQHGH